MLSLPIAKVKKFKLAFGSCYGMLDHKSDIFKSIVNYEPHMWLWLGDAAYTDDILAGACIFSPFTDIDKFDNSMPLEYVY